MLQVNQRGSQVAVAVEHLHLDELELGSLRGQLTSCNVDVDLGARQGRGRLMLVQPKYSGLRGNSLTANAR